METNWNMRVTIFTSRTALISEKQVVMILKLGLLKKKMITFFKSLEGMLESTTLFQTVVCHKEC